MEIYLIIMAMAFICLLVLNIRKGLNKSWLIVTLLTVASLIALAYIIEFVACKLDPGPFCGTYPLVIWIYIAPILLNIQQLISLLKNKKRNQTT